LVIRWCRRAVCVYHDIDAPACTVAQRILPFRARFVGSRALFGWGVAPLSASIGNDAGWILAAHRLEFYRLMLIEQPDDATQNQTPIAFECFAENYDHAVDQAENAYPGCKVLGMDF
jgi:hypothetical protein